MGASHRLRAGSCIVRASQKAASLLAEGKRVYESGDRLAAMGVYEKVLAEGAALSPEQRRAALYGTIAVHASFGDVELAQMTLRDAIQAGLNFEEAQEDPANPKMQSSQQILIQLNRFNKQMLRNMEFQAQDRAIAAAKAAATVPRTRVSADADLSKLLGGSAERKDDQGIDASPAAIAKRVAGVVVAGILLGTALFYLGLQYLFPPV